MNSFSDKLANLLEQHRQKDHLRALPADACTSIDFTSNDYLGFARSQELFRNIETAYRQQPVSNGATGSRLLSGNSDLNMRVESALAQRFHSEAALIFNSGYTANLAVLSSIPARGDTLIYDEHVHASIKDGARLSLAHRFPFHHNNADDLEEKLKAAKGRRFIIIESIYSMDGDECPLASVVKLARKYDATIILDEAHGTGVRGPGGGGLAMESGLHDSIAVRIYTFGKAMGVHGACVTGDKNLIAYLINFARSFIYTTALPSHSIVSIDQSFKFLDANISLQNELKTRISTYAEVSVKSNPGSAIQTILVPGNSKVREAGRQMQQEGYDVRPILSPTVREGTERLRICLHTYNTSGEISNFAHAIRTFVS